MATVPMKIQVGLTDSEYRPCYVLERPSRKGAIEERVKHKALFHKWTLEQEPVGPGLTVGSHPGGQISRTMAVVELEDGKTRLVVPELLLFVDTEETMRQIAWPGEEHDNL